MIPHAKVAKAAKKKAHCFGEWFMEVKRRIFSASFAAFATFA